MNDAFGVTYERLQPKLFLFAGPSATKHGPNSMVIYHLSSQYFNHLAGGLILVLMFMCVLTSTCSLLIRAPGILPC